MAALKAIVAASALLALVGGAYASDSCTAGTADDQNTLTISTDVETCTTITGAASATFTVNPADAEFDTYILVWNSNQEAAGWGATPPTLDGASVFTDINNVIVADGGSANGRFGYFFENNLEPGTHTLAFSETAEWSVAVLRDIADNMDGDKVSGGKVSAAGSAVSFSGLVHLINAANPVKFPIDEQFVEETFMMRELITTATPSYTDTRVTLSGAGSDTAVLDNTVAGTTTATWDNIIDVTNAAQFEFAAVDITTEYYDWKASIVFSGTFDLTTAREYNTLGATWSVATPSATTSRIFQVPRTSFWYNFTVVVALGDYREAGFDESRAGSPATGTVQIGDSAAGEASDRTDGSFATANRVINADFDISANPMANFQLLSPADSAKPGRFFVRVASQTGADWTSMISLKAVLTNLDGECSTGYTACNRQEDNHPSSKKFSSANEDSTRMRQCALVPSAADPKVPTTKCVECQSDCDCGTAQYCHMDSGVCPTDNSGNFHTCDQDSNRKLGLCVAKDPTGDILGQPCRTDQGSTATNGPRLTSNAVALPLVSETVGEALNNDRTLTASAFCGGVLFYPDDAEYVPGLGATTIAMGGSRVARSVLWEGTCVNHMCYECSSSDRDCGAGGAKTCVNGEWLDTIVVDGTVRTFNVNTVAGTLLTGVVMVILVQFCMCVRIYQAFRVSNPKKTTKDNPIYKRVVEME